METFGSKCLLNFNQQILKLVDSDFDQHWFAGDDSKAAQAVKLLRTCLWLGAALQQQRSRVGTIGSWYLRRTLPPRRHDMLRRASGVTRTSADCCTERSPAWQTKLRVLRTLPLYTTHQLVWAKVWISERREKPGELPPEWSMITAVTVHYGK